MNIKEHLLDLQQRAADRANSDAEEIEWLHSQLEYERQRNANNVALADDEIKRLNGIIDRLRIAYAELEAEKRDV